MSDFMHGQQVAPQSTKTFKYQHVLNDITRDPEAERLALQFMNKWAPDLVGVVLGHAL